MEDIQSVRVAGRQLIVNGKPFIPIFAWWVHPPHLSALAETGVNTALSPRADPAYAEQAAGLGLYVGANPLAGLAGHRRLVFWLQEDEPDIRIPEGPRLSAAGQWESATRNADALIARALAECEPRRRECRALGDGRPVFLNFSYLFLSAFGAPPETAQRLYGALAKTGDAISWDLYPLASWGHPDRLPLMWVGTRWLRDLVPNKPLFCFLECVQCASAKDHPTARDPTADEMRNQAWQVVAAGATGIGWFTYGLRFSSFDVSEPNRTALRRINEEVQRHADWILAPEVLGAVRRGADGLPDLIVSVRREGAQRLAILVNPRYVRQRLDAEPSAWESWPALPDGDLGALLEPFGSAGRDPLDPLEVRLLESAPAP